jgi:hypothetical protein
MITVVIILMYTASLELQLLPCVNILNLCTNIKLVSSVYFGNGMTCPKLSNQRIDIDAKMNTSFEICAIQDEFEGALLFKLQRYSHDRYNIDIFTAETNKKESTHAYMLVAWKVRDIYLFVHVALVEHAKEYSWSKERLKKLYNNHRDRLKKYNDTISDTWFIDDNMVLKTTFDANVLKRIPELSISISEKEKDDYAMRPFFIHLERQVSMMLSIFLILTYALSLTLHKSMIMTICNLHSDIELVSPLYFCNYGTYYAYPVKRENAGTIMKIDFRFDQDEFGGILMYKVQRKTRSNRPPSMDPIYARIMEETSKMMRLLVIWKMMPPGKPKVNTMLLECDDLDLNEDKLAQLFDNVNNIHSVYNPHGDIWFMSNHTALKITHQVMQETGFELRILISEIFTSLNIMIPMWINSERQVRLEMVIDFY